MVEKHFAIVVRIPEPKKEIFIAMPFSSDFDNLRKVIVESVVTVGLTPCQLELNPKSNKFLEGIFTHTRETWVVIAVCSPEEETATANPNIMYEVGLAHSIGKSTIILTNNIDKLPSNLKGENILEYKKGDEIIPEFKDKITTEIYRAKERAKNGVTDDSFDEISLAYARHQLVLRAGSKITFHSFKELEKENNSN